MSLANEIIYTIFPVTAILLGGVLAVRWPPGPSVLSAVQHIAAGAVVAAVATEIVPSVVHADQPVAVVVGFLAGTLAMVALETVSAGVAKARGGLRSAGLIGATATDVAIDGIVLGLGFAAGRKEGLLLAVALTLELVFLGLAVTASISDATQRTIAGIVVGLAALFSAGVFLGVQLGQLSPAPFTALLSFGSAALLYLVTEELLAEAHETPDRPYTPAFFLLAFLGVLIVDMVA